MLEQETASIIKYVLDHAPGVQPYYFKVPEGFLVPSVFFPIPEIDATGDTFTNFALDYRWYIKFFHRTTSEAYTIANGVVVSIMAARNLVPLISQAGQYTNSGVRLHDPKIREIAGSDGCVQVELSWNSPRPYFKESVDKANDFSYDISVKE